MLIFLLASFMRISSVMPFAIGAIFVAIAIAVVPCCLVLVGQVAKTMGVRSGVEGGIRRGFCDRGDRLVSAGIKHLSVHASVALDKSDLALSSIGTRAAVSIGADLPLASRFPYLDTLVSLVWLFCFPDSQSTLHRQRHLALT